MKKSLWFLTGLVAFLCILVAGCTQTPQGGVTPAPTTQPTTVAATPTQVPATPATPAQPGFIDGPVPAQYAVDVQVDRNTVAIKPTIIVTFRGGKGINFVDSMDVVVSRSDGQVVTGSLQRPSVNSQLELEGTRGTDRVEVFINLVTGDRYRVYNQALPFRSYS
ncbi:MAG: hypothetical protein QFX32_08300 [Methanolinea sp.]|nr:hypothetical protein [Methanolinea sp.]